MQEISCICEFSYCNCYHLIISVYCRILCIQDLTFAFLAHLAWNARVSFCDRWMSGVCRASCVVRRASCVYNWSVYTLAVTFLIQSSSNLVRMFVLMISRTSSNLGHEGSKTRSLGQILEKSCLHSRGHIFGLIILKFCQDVCFDNILDRFESGSREVKN